MHFAALAPTDTAHTHRLIGQSMETGKNKLLILMKVENIQNPRDVYWQAQSYDLTQNNNQTIDLANL